MILVVGVLATLLGLSFVVGCFVQVDSPQALAKIQNDPVRVLRMQTLQDAWRKIGRVRQFIVSALAPLILGISLLAVWHDRSLAKYYLAVAILFAAALGLVMLVKRHASAVLDPALPGHEEVLKVIRQNVRMCLSFSLVFVVLAARA